MLTSRESPKLPQGKLPSPEATSRSQAVTKLTGGSLQQPCGNHCDETIRKSPYLIISPLQISSRVKNTKRCVNLQQNAKIGLKLAFSLCKKGPRLGKNTQPPVVTNISYCSHQVYRSPFHTTLPAIIVHQCIYGGVVTLKYYHVFFLLSQCVSVEVQNIIAKCNS